MKTKANTKAIANTLIKMAERKGSEHKFKITFEFINKNYENGLLKLTTPEICELFYELEKNIKTKFVDIITSKKSVVIKLILLES